MDSNQFSEGHSQTVVGTCVKCGGLVRIPVTANPRATVRCPRCEETFELGEILEKAAPALEVVEQSPSGHGDQSHAVPEPEVPSYNPENGKFEVPAIIQRNTKFKRRRRKEKQKHPLHDETWKKRSTRVTADPEGGESGAQAADAKTSKPGLSNPAKADVGAASAANKTSDRREREYNRRRQRAELARRQSRAEQAGKGRRTTSGAKPAAPSSVIEMVKVVAGGLLALPVAQLLIWWVVGSDPLGIAPAVSRSIPFVVPARYQVQEDANDLPLSQETDPAAEDSTTN